MAEILGADPEIEVIGTAADPFVAARRIQDEVPDVITLDVEMPRMDGITFLRKLMAQHPLPVVMCSSLTEDGSATLMQALEAGARRCDPQAAGGRAAISPGREHPHLRCREGGSTGSAEASIGHAGPRIRQAAVVPQPKLTAGCHHAGTDRRSGHGAHH